MTSSPTPQPLTDEELAEIEQEFATGFAPKMRNWSKVAAELIVELRAERTENERLRGQVENRDVVAMVFDGEEAPKVLLDTLEALRAERAENERLRAELELHKEALGEIRAACTQATEVLAPHSHAGAVSGEAS